jgi:hypothetical protein
MAAPPFGRATTDIAAPAAVSVVSWRKKVIHAGRPDGPDLWSAAAGPRERAGGRAVVWPKPGGADRYDKFKVEVAGTRSIESGKSYCVLLRSTP